MWRDFDTRAVSKNVQKRLVIHVHQRAPVCFCDKHAHLGEQKWKWLRFIALTYCLMGLLTACGATTGSVNTKATATLNATAIAQPVLIYLAATSQGTIAADSLEIDVVTTVINQTGQIIHLTSYATVACLPTPPVVFSLVNQDQKTVWQETAADNCVLPPAHDVVTIAPNGTQQWTTKLDLRYFLTHSVSSLSAGDYTLIAQGLLWHEGTISATGETNAPHGYANGQTSVTLT